MCPRAAFPLDRASLEKAIEGRDCRTVALLNGDVAGFADLYGYEPGRHCFIGHVIVDPARRGQGVGRQLIAAMVRQATDKYNIERVSLSCFSDNVPALLMYGKMGFTPFAIEARQRPDGTPAALLHMTIAAELMA